MKYTHFLKTSRVSIEIVYTFVKILLRKVQIDLKKLHLSELVLYLTPSFYSLRQAARPDEMRTRRCERSVKLWLLEAKAIPPKKRYYCEILLDDTLYAK